MSANTASYEKNKQLLAIATERAQIAEELQKQSAMAKFAVLDYVGKRVELEQNVQMAQAEMSSAEAEIAGAKQMKAQYLAEWNKILQEEMLKSRQEYDKLKEAERKAELKNSLIVIKAPVSGIVHNLEIHTLGTVVTEAQQLLAVVPDNTDMEVEAWLDNRDIGFVHPGQDAEIKVEAYNFQKFGTLKGKVKDISADAIEDKEKGLVYKAIVELDDKHLLMDGKKLNIYPGMNVSVEVKTRKKRIIDFFLEPFQTYKNEALRER